MRRACFKPALLLYYIQTKFGRTTFAYDGLGRRVKKDGIVFTYDSDGRLIKQSNGFEFVYDNAGIVGFKYNDKQYFYRKDVQGNIKSILDSAGEVVVNYVYDAWGNHKVLDGSGNEITHTAHIGFLNPFRYRGYYYDTETGLYYLQTRYYDPELGRFISQDSLEYAEPETINGLNLYAYCGNNPVMNVDPTGTWSWKGFWTVVGAVLVVAAVTALVVVTAGAAAVALGASATVVSAAMTGAAIGGGIAGISEIVNQLDKNGIDDFNMGSVIIETFIGAAIGAVSSVGSATTSAIVRTGSRFAKIGLSALGSALHGINEGKSFAVILGDMGLAMAGSLFMQSFGFISDKIKGRTSSAILQSLKLDGALGYGIKEILSTGLGISGREILRYQMPHVGIVF